MSSSYKPQVGDIVIPSCGKFEGLRCRVAIVGGHIGVECLEKAEEGHNLEGRLSKPNGWWYFAEHLRLKEKDNSTNSTNSTNSKFKVGDEVVSNLYPNRGPGIIVSIPYNIVVKHYTSFPEGHDCDNTVPYGQGWWYTHDDLSKVTTNFKVGDRVSSPPYLERGPGTVRKSDCKDLILVEHDDIFEDGHDGDGTCIYGTGWYYNKSQIQIAHEVKPEPEEPKPDKPQEVKSLHGYSLGDRVKGHYGPGTVVHFSEEGSIGVEHDKYNGFFHSCNEHGKEGHCWYYKTEKIEKLEPVFLTGTGIGVTGITGVTEGVTKGMTRAIISSSADPSILANFDADLKTCYGHNADSGFWAQIEPISKSKKPKPSVDKYIQNPIISKKTKKKKSLVIV